MAQDKAFSKKRVWAVLGAAAAVGGVANFIWPTPYIYLSEYPTVMRVNRFTGVEEWSTGTGWQGADGQEPSIDLTGQVSLTDMWVDDSTAKLRLRNNGDVGYRGLHFRFTVLNSEGVVVGRTIATAAELRRGETLEVETDVPSSGSIQMNGLKLRLDEVFADAEL